MKYDFDRVIDRRNSLSLKWNVNQGELPMWVADMDFAAAPCITDALNRITDRGVLGYSIIPDEWYDAYIGWWKSRHGFDLRHEWLIFCTGVIPAISSAVRKFTSPAENVVVLTPVYNIFFNCIYNNGRNILECPLCYSDGEYGLDMDRLEGLFSLPQTTMLLLSNPQSPSGKVWDKQTLAKIGELCEKYGVIVISDEIHCDLTNPGVEYTPFASVSDACRNNSITCMAPTKAFNIAGIQTAAVVVPNEHLYNRMNRALNTDEVAEPNVFAVSAAIAAFTSGGVWLDELRSYIYGNKQTVAEYVSENIPSVSAAKSESTYLMWLDVSKISESSDEFARLVRSSTGLYLSGGSQYRGNGNGFVRMNVACPGSVLRDGLERLNIAVGCSKSYISK